MADSEKQKLIALYERFGEHMARIEFNQRQSARMFGEFARRYTAKKREESRNDIKHWWALYKRMSIQEWNKWSKTPRPVTPNTGEKE